MSNILVTGATGHLGKTVTESLLNKTGAANFSIMVRDAAKATDFAAAGIDVRTGDYNDQTSLVIAFTGIDKIYMVSGNDLANRIAQHDNVIAAAKEAGVKHIVYTSYQRKNETESSPIAFVGDAHLHTERKLKASGLTYTILQHSIYADMIPIYVGPHLLETKTIYLPAGEGKTTYVVRTDFGDAGAIILLDETGAYDNQRIELGGTLGVSWNEVAEQISGITGVEISYVSPSNEEFKAALTKANVPEEYIGLFIGFCNAAKEGEFENVTDNLKRILGREPKPVAEYLNEVYGK